MEEGEELKQIFRMFDLNGDGLITKQELKQGLHKLGERLNDVEIDALMEEADIDGDGNIDYGEFVELIGKK